MEGETPLFLSFLIDNSRCLDPPSKDFFSRYCEAVSTPLQKASLRELDSPARCFKSDRFFNHYGCV